MQYLQNFPTSDIYTRHVPAQLNESVTLFHIKTFVQIGHLRGTRAYCKRLRFIAVMHRTKPTSMHLGSQRKAIDRMTLHTRPRTKGSRGARAPRAQPPQAGHVPPTISINVCFRNVTKLPMCVHIGPYSLPADNFPAVSVKTCNFHERMRKLRTWSLMKIVVRKTTRSYWRRKTRFSPTFPAALFPPCSVKWITCRVALVRSEYYLIIFTDYCVFWCKIE